MTVSYWQADGRQPVRDVDILVVGAGVAGCSAAYFASQSGREVVLTDMRGPGMGASGRNAGFVITGLDTYYHHAIEQLGHERVREVWNLSRQTHAYWREFAAKENVQMEQCGSLLLAESEAEAEELRLTAAVMQADGIDVIYYDYDPLDRGYYAAIRQSWDAAIQPYQLVQAVFKHSGAEFIGDNELYTLEQTERGCVIVYTQRFVFRARKVLLCTNAYSERIDPYFADKVIPTRAQCLVTEPLDKPVIDVCGYSDYGYMYYRMTFDNRLLIGGGRKNHQAQENGTADDRITDAVQGVLDAYLRERFPEVTAPVARRWAGIMGFSPDHVPLVGTLPDKPDVGFAVGFTGHGMALAAATAERAVDLLLNGTHPGVLDVTRLG